ncbi:alpha,alpha-trehalase TreA [Klebsiella pneumoniae]|uniref:alpha,alpha-trehalase TreA n=1 Tax=Klebsiella pneumoniae TaxID=573 RepID=UPI001888D8CA|nr:alpha,alpha-trehalase TreA [Klebsiella pneumoniae]
MTSTDARRPAALPCSLRLAIGGALIALMSLNAQAEDGKTAPPPSPDILLGPLFNDVQSAKLFADQKTFADAIPNSDPLMILADYRMQKNQASFDLRHFVELNFTLPKENDTYVPPKGQTLRQHIDGLWPVLTRSTVEVEKWDSLLPLPKPYVVPGGRFREVYYWDSYFTMLGLAESGHWDKVEDMVANFAAEIDAWGHIPNGNRTYYLSRSQPPFFSFMVSLLATHDGDQVLKTYQPQLEKEYRYWMAGADALAPGSADKRAVRMADGALLNRYWDDNDTPRPESWLDDVKTAKSNPNRPATEIYRDLRSAATAAALFPLYVNAASRERATKVAAAAESRLLKPGGLTTTTVNSGQQWDAPNGWAPLQWVAVEGLQNYGQQKIAMEVTWRFLTNVQHTYDSKQKLVEKYDVSSTGTGGGGGEYPLQDGFGWTNGVTLKMLDLICPQEKPCDALPATRPATTPSPQDKPVAAPAANDPAPAEPQKTGS